MPETDPSLDFVAPIAIRPDERVLIYGIGNAGRGDDGLGIRLIERLEAAGYAARVRLEANYQLNVEDALLLSEHDLVIFADASKKEGEGEPCSLTPLQPSADIPFSTHALGMENVLSLCASLYGRAPRAYVLAIPGSGWELTENLTPEAESRLSRTFTVLEDMLQCMKSPL